LVDIFYVPYFGCFERNGLFQHPQAFTLHPRQRNWRRPAARREILESVLFATEKQLTSIANGGSDPVPGRAAVAPGEFQRLPGALFRQLTLQWVSSQKMPLSPFSR
jgi:hypothetical protein